MSSQDFPDIFCLHLPPSSSQVKVFIACLHVLTLAGSFWNFNAAIAHRYDSLGHSQPPTGGKNDVVVTRHRRRAKHHCGRLVGDSYTGYLIVRYVPYLLEFHIARYLVGLQFFLKPALSPHAVNGLVAGRLDDPCSWEFGHPGLWPLVDSSPKGFLSSVFRRIEVPAEPNQGSDNPALLGTIDYVQSGGNILAHAPS